MKKVKNDKFNEFFNEFFNELNFMQDYENNIKELYKKVCDVVYAKALIYYDNYGEFPEYIKLPSIIYYKLLNNCNILKKIYGGCLDIDFEDNTLFDAFICVTSSITTINEIEVF